jgi:hypothetical protein
MKLWKVRIKTYYFGMKYYDLFVYANTEENMVKLVKLQPIYMSHTEDAEIESYTEIDLTNETNRVL